MSGEELRIVVDIMSNADGGCPSCVVYLWAKLVCAFPEAEDAVVSHGSFEAECWEGAVESEKARQQYDSERTEL